MFAVVLVLGKQRHLGAATRPHGIKLNAGNVNHGVAQWEEDNDQLELDCSSESPPLSSRRRGSRRRRRIARDPDVIGFRRRRGEFGSQAALSHRLLERRHEQFLARRLRQLDGAVGQEVQIGRPGRRLCMDEQRRRFRQAASGLPDPARAEAEHPHSFSQSGAALGSRDRYGDQGQCSSRGHRPRAHSETADRHLRA